MNISFYKPSDEIVPTILRLKVDGIQVHYKQINCSRMIVYEFTVFQEDVDNSTKIINEIVKLMENQSEDSCQSWRIFSVDLDGHSEMYNRFIVKFRVRDSY